MSDLHSEALREGEWWACSFPERPSNGFIAWDTDCRACMLHAWASILDGRGPQTHVEPDADGAFVTVAVLDDPVEETRSALALLGVTV